MNAEEKMGYPEPEIQETLKGEEFFRVPQSLLIEGEYLDTMTIYLNKLKSQYDKDIHQLNNFDEYRLRRMTFDGRSTMRPIAKAQLRLISEIESIEHTLKALKRVGNKKKYLRCESEVSSLAQKDGDVEAIVREENITNISGNMTVDVEMGHSIDSHDGQREQNAMGDFPTRPVHIYNGTIAIGGKPFVILPIWDELSREPSIRAKLRNMAYFKADVKVRVTFSGTPFHQGFALIAYKPYGDYNLPFSLLESSAVADPGFEPLLINYLSQSKGSCLVNYADNTPVVLHCPFISPKPMHRLYNYSSSTLGAAAAYEDLTRAGDIVIMGVTDLKAMGAAPTEVYYQVYAWFENVEFGTNTATQIVISTESKKDERNTGPIEKVSTALAKMSKHIPIPAYGLASNLIFSGISDIAAIFGWSKPTVNDRPQKIHIETFTNGALTIGCDTNKKIALDPKQEVTVDPRYGGIDYDDMTLEYVCGVKSIIDTFSWTAAAIPLSGSIWSCVVAPNLVTRNAITNIYVQPSALAFAANMFTYWTGDIIFTFTIACTAYHRGVLAIIWEPNLYQYSLITNSASLNKQYTTLWDIQQTQSIQVRVSWASYRSWLRTYSANSPAEVNTVSGSDTGRANGFIYVTPFTDLQSPDTTVSPEIIVSVHSDNMMFNGFTGGYNPTRRAIYSESAKENCILQVPVSTIDLNASSATHKLSSVEYFGERPTSWRQLLKRYMTNREASIVYPINAAPWTHKTTCGIWPRNNLKYGNTSGPEVNYDLFTHLAYAYMGYRGGYKIRARTSLSQSLSLNAMSRVTLEAPTTATVDTPTWSAMSGNLAYVSGSVNFLPNINGAIEVEFPYYTNNSFLFSFGDLQTPDTSIDFMEGTFFRNFAIRTDEAPYAAAVARSFVVDYAAAEDFTFLRFEGAPYYST